MESLDVEIIASSSKGNCVIVSDGHSKIMMDCGIPYSKLIVNNIRLTEIEAVLITHEHRDHCMLAGELWTRGAPIYMSRGTYEYLPEEIELKPNILTHKVQVELANWIVFPFHVEHDAAEAMGFLFQSKNTGKTGVYIVDSAIVYYDFPGVNTWILEANYSEDILNSSDAEEWLKRRIRKSHFSIEGLKRFLSSSNLETTEMIYLLHLSDRNSDEKRFISEIKALTGVPVRTDTYFKKQRWA